MRISELLLFFLILKELLKAEMRFKYHLYAKERNSFFFVMMS